MSYASMCFTIRIGNSIGTAASINVDDIIVISISTNMISSSIAPGEQASNATDKRPDLW